MQEYAIYIEKGIFVGMWKVADPSDLEVLAVQMGYKSLQDLKEDGDVDLITIFEADIDEI